MKSILLSSTALSLIALTAAAAPPVLNSLEPWGAQRGKAVTLMLAGVNLNEGSKIVSTLPATFTPLNANDPSSRKLPFLVEIKPDTPVGLYPIRIQSANGLSNVLLFSIGSLPEVSEIETETHNDTIATAQKISSNAVLVNGTLRASDRDFYEVHGKAGEKRVFEIEARRMGSAIDPSLRIYDAAGKLLARIDDTPTLGVDCRTEFTFPREGKYYVEVHDARFSDQSANFYRLKMGMYPFADAIFPLGGKRNQDMEVELSGGNLPAPIKVKPTWGASPMIHFPTGASLPIPFVASNAEEVLETASNTIRPNTVINGRIAKPNEIDRYTLAVEPGKSYLVEAEARALGPSRLDALVTVYDAKGQRIDSAGDKPPQQAVNAFIVAGEFSSDPYLVFQAPKDARQVTIAIEDLNGNGGPAYVYRLFAREQQPDFELTLATPYINIPASGSQIVTVNADRRGFMGDIQLTAANLPADLSAAGGSIPAEIVDVDTRQVSRRGVLTLTAKAGAKPRALDLEIWGEATLPDGTKLRRKASGPGMITTIRGNFGFVDSSRRNIRPFQAPWLGLDLPAMIGYQPAATLAVNVPPRIRIIQGMKYDFPWTYQSKIPGMPAVTSVASDTPGGRDLRISGGERRGAGGSKAGAGMLTMNTTIGTPPGIFDVILSARAGNPMNEEIIYAPAITVEVVQGYGVIPAAQPAALKLNGKVTREQGFSGAITITPDALPLGVSCPPAEVDPAASEFSIACQATAEAPAGQHKILLNPASILPEGEKGKVPYKIAPVEATLLIQR